MLGETEGKHPRFWTVEDWVDDTRANSPTSGIEVVDDDAMRVYNPAGNWAVCYTQVAPPHMDSEVSILRRGDMDSHGMRQDLITGEIVE